MTTPAIPLEPSRPQTEAHSVRWSRIVLRDYWSFILTLLAGTALVTVVGIPFLLVLAPLLIWRARNVRRTLEEGDVTVGIVLRKRFLRGEWSITYGFKVEDDVVQTGNYVLGFKLPIDERQKVLVRYDPEKPTRAFLPALYSAKSS